MVKGKTIIISDIEKLLCFTKLADVGIFVVFDRYHMKGDVRLLCHLILHQSPAYLKSECH